MSSYESFSPPKRSNKWLLWSLIFIFLITLTTFTILEVRSLSDEEPSVIRIIMNRINVPQEESHKFVLVNAKNVPQERDELVRAIVRQVEENPQAVELERKTRDTEEIPKQSPVALEHHKNNNSYYEEQTPVVVYSKTDPDPPLSYRQNAPPVPYGSHEEEPYYDGEDNGEYANDNDAFYRPQYDDDSREDFSPPQNYANADDESEGRSSQTRQYDNYYRQWHYATPSPPTSSLQKSNRKLQTMTEDPR
uniref:Uncharacterized protein n=1 Tax=Stomoxys calcitrans TaxID=35570 RepID=A0A1I8P8B4_STOCA